MLEESRAGDLVYSLEQDVDQVVTLGSDIVPALTRIGMTVTLSLVVMWKLDRPLTALTALAIPLLLIAGLYSRLQLRLFAERSRAAALERSAFSMEAFTASVQIRVLRALDRVRGLYRACVQESVAAFLSERRRQIAYGCASLAIVAAASTAMLGFGGASVIHHGMTIGAYVAFYTYLVRLFEPINTAVDLFAKVQRGGVSIDRLRALRVSANQQTSNSQTRFTILTQESRRQYYSLCGSVECVDLSFSYETRGSKVLKGISFRANRGTVLLLDGPTGCGKSTLLKILAGIYSDYDGVIRIGGVDIRSLYEREHLFGFAIQHPVLFSASIRDNLLLGSPAAAREDIEEALYLSCADRIVRGLREGLGYRISQSGAGLSGGERQRIALARVLLQRRPILLLDEGLTGIDDETKAEILARLAKYTATRITILVSHDRLCKEWADDVVPLPLARNDAQSDERFMTSIDESLCPESVVRPVRHMELGRTSI